MVMEDNPAGRLHKLLSEYARIATANEHSNVQYVWADVLDVPPEEVPLHISDVMRLLQEVRQSAQEMGGPFEPIPNHIATLTAPVWPSTQGFGHPARQVMPDGTAMQALAMYAYALSNEASEGTLPPADQLSELRESVVALLNDVTNTDALPHEIRRQLLHRLADMIDALDLVGVGGPEEIKRAAESLAVTAVQFDDAVKADPEARGFVQRSWGQAKEILMVLAAVAAIGADGPKSIDTYTKVFQLGAGIEQKALPPGDESP